MLSFDDLGPVEIQLKNLKRSTKITKVTQIIKRPPSLIFVLFVNFVD